MPEPYKVMRRKVADRLKDKTAPEKEREIKKILQEINPVFRGIVADLERELQRIQRHKAAVRSGRRKASFKKHSPQAVIAGAPNSGRSTLLSRLTSAEPEISDYPFCTTEPIAGILEYRDVRIQLVETLPIYEDLADENLETFGLIKNSDSLILMINLSEELEMLFSEFEKADIVPYNRNVEKYEKFENGKHYIPSIVVYRRRMPDTNLECVSAEDIDAVLEDLYNSFNIMRIYMRDANRREPVVLMGDDMSVRNAIEKYNSRLLRSFKYALLTGSSAAHPNQKVGLTHKLDDGDELQIKA